MPHSRVLKFNDANIALQKSLIQDAKAGAAKTAASSSNAAGSSKPGGTSSRRDERNNTSRLGKRRKEDVVSSFSLYEFRSILSHVLWCVWCAQQDDSGAKKPELKLAIPDVLKVLMVDDWEYITKNGRVGQMRPPKMTPYLIIRPLIIFSLYLYPEHQLCKKSWKNFVPTFKLPPTSSRK